MTVPEHLYKYRSLRGENRRHTQALIMKGEIYFAHRREFADPFDCALHVNAVADPNTRARRIREINPEASPEEVARLIADASSPRLQREMEDNARSGIATAHDGCGIFCLCERPDALQMWTHYADGHQGICFRFGSRDNRLFGCDVLQVQYHERYPELSMYDVCDRAWTERYLTTKASAWRHEHEWRIVYHALGPQYFPPDWLTGIILGARIPPENRADVLRWSAESPAKPRVFQANLSERAFALEILPWEQGAA